MMKVAVTPLDVKSRLSRWGVQQLVLATEAGFILIIEKGGIRSSYALICRTVCLCHKVLKALGYFLNKGTKL
jgi:hypothetical protein